MHRVPSTLAAQAPTHLSRTVDSIDLAPTNSSACGVEIDAAVVTHIARAGAQGSHTAWAGRQARAAAASRAMAFTAASLGTDLTAGCLMCSRRHEVRGFLRQRCMRHVHLVTTAACQRKRLLAVGDLHRFFCGLRRFCRGLYFMEDAELGQGCASLRQRRASTPLVRRPGATTDSTQPAARRAPRH